MSGRAVGDRCRDVRRRLMRFAFERGDLDETCERVELALEHPDRIHDEASGWTYLRRALRGREIHEDDVFLDAGSGKGPRHRQRGPGRFAPARTLDARPRSRTDRTIIVYAGLPASPTATTAEAV